MPVFANEWPANWEMGSDVIQIDDPSFSVWSEPGIVSLIIANDQGYLDLEEAKRLLSILEKAIKNSEAPIPSADIDDTVILTSNGEEPGT